MRRVSVVMPVYNAESTLRRSVESVLAQTHRDLELVAVDDGSRDASPGMLAAFARADPRVKVIRQANAGVAAARNAGVAAATGTHVAFLDSDDWGHERKLERQLEHLDATGARIAYACYQRVDEAGVPLSTVCPPQRVDHSAMLRSNRIGNLTGLYDRALGDAVFQRIGHEDYAFWLEMVRRAGYAVRVGNEPLAWYCVRSSSLSSDKAKAARWQWNIYRNIERLSLPLAAWYFLHYAGNALTKRR
jgi:teichuronic acid biosynthesis glycosyltransferase TuaG